MFCLIGVPAFAATLFVFWLWLLPSDTLAFPYLDSNHWICDLLDQCVHPTGLRSKTKLDSKAGAWVVGRESCEIERRCKT